jgi:hypothetical protein
MGGRTGENICLTNTISKLQQAVGTVQRIIGIFYNGQ